MGRKVKAGSVVVIRYEGPKSDRGGGGSRGPDRRRRMVQRLAHLASMGKRTRHASSCQTGWFLGAGVAEEGA
jgi:hypothetical protein